MATSDAGPRGRPVLGGAGTRARAVTWLSCVVAFATACGGGRGEPPQPDDADEQANVAIARQITATLADGAPDVDELEVTYVDNASSRARVAISLRCDSCEGDDLVARALEHVWTSRISPLASITIYGQVIKTRTRIDETYLLPDDEDELVRRYGERPVSD